MPMNLLLKSMTHTFQGICDVKTERQPDRLTIACKDLSGNVVAVRVFSERQLRNRELVREVMLDLERSMFSARESLCSDSKLASDNLCA